MRLVVKTRHETNERQAEMIAEYVRRDNKVSLAAFDEESMLYSLTAKGVENLETMRANQQA